MIRLRNPFRRPEPTPAELLAATLKPDPAAPFRRLARVSEERRARTAANLAEIERELGL